MKLLVSDASPFARKVRITAGMKGLDHRIALIEPDSDDHAALRAQNPLGKIPVLILEDRTILHDSHVICEYLDAQVASPVLFPGEGDKRWRMLTDASMADGILDAAVLIVYEERYRPAGMRVQGWLDMQQAKIDAALAHLEAAPPQWQSHPDYSHIAIACALGYLDLRQGGAWRASHPQMVAWLNAFRAAVPAFDKTAPQAV